MKFKLWTIPWQVLIFALLLVLLSIGSKEILEDGRIVCLLRQGDQFVDIFSDVSEGADVQLVRIGRFPKLPNDVSIIGRFQRPRWAFGIVMELKTIKNNEYVTKLAEYKVVKKVLPAWMHTSHYVFVKIAFTPDQYLLYQESLTQKEDIVIVRH